MTDLRIRLFRFHQSAAGTNGVLLIPGVQALFTCERPSVPALRHAYGVPGQSCVPVGEYKLSQHYSPSRREDRWYLSDPPMLTVRQHDALYRWGIMFHIANHPNELQGCIAPGLNLMRDDMFPHAVSRSGPALSMMNGALSELSETHQLRLVVSEGFDANAVRELDQPKVTTA